MKRNKAFFSSFHGIYRLLTTTEDLKSFAVGVCRIFKNSFTAEKAVMIIKNIGAQGFLKVRLENRVQFVKKGGRSILTSIEKEVLKYGKEIVIDHRLIYPFIFNDTMGAIYVRRGSKVKTFDEAERKWFSSLCEEVSIGFKVFILYREQQKLMLSYIKSMSNFLNQYVPTSYLHTKTMLKLIKLMGKAMDLSEIEISSLERASMLHDAGKMEVPSRLLRKQKPLTNEEFKLIAKHPRKGAELFKKLDILKPVIPIILHHHERYDGKGYPSGLKKEKIPIGSRILAVLDSFDAMYFGRPYRKRRPFLNVIQEFTKQKGRQFDPKVVDVFLRILKRKAIRKDLKI